VALMDKDGRDGKGPAKWRSKRTTLSWTGGPPESMRDAIGRITDSGAAILFARTSDGGALVIQVLAGNERSKEYITEAGDIVACLAWLTEAYG